MAFTIGSLFDGSGGFPLAASLCGGTPLWASEIEPYPIAVTKNKFPGMKHLGDISKINGAEVEPVDVISFGSPCQDLSVAGKRAGLKHEANGDEETTRSGLFMEAVRIIQEMKEATHGRYPRFALWENVPGAFSSNKGEDFRIVLEELIKIVEPGASMPEVPKNGWPYADSYIGDGWSLAYRVFDAQFWGVPQRRRRVYLVLDLGGQCAGTVSFERDGLRGHFAQGRLPWQRASGNAENCLDSRSYAVGINGDIAGTLDANYYKGRGMRQGVEREVVASVAYSIENHPADSRVNIDYSGKVQTLTSRMGTGGGNVPMVMEKRNAPNVFDVEMEVAVRKYEVDRDRLIELLRSHKGSFTNAQIAEALHRPLTLVEHWFRKDACFAVPDPDVWFRLKRLLGIETTEFDACITEYEFKGGNYDMRNRIYTGDIAPTLTGGCGNHLHLVSDQEKTEETYIVRRLTPTECARLQGFPDDWGHFNEKDSFSPEEMAFWQEVRNTQASINGKSTKEYTEKQMLSWYNRLHTDGAEYKMWGNGIALPTALYCMQGIAEVFNQ